MIRRRLVIAAAALALIGLVGWAAVSPPAVVLRWWNPNSRPELRGLVAAAGPDRRIEGRLTGGFAWGPAPNVTRGTRGAATAARIQVAAGLLGVRVSEHPSPAALADSASGLLYLGRADEAVQALEQATEAFPNSAPYWSDLAAAYLARFSTGGPATDLPRSLDAVERSLAISSLPEALFNRALIIQRLNLRQLANEAWKNYLRVDAVTLWATEAEARLTLLNEASARAERASRSQLLREAVVDDVLSRWAVSSQPDEADRALKEAREASRELKRASRDELIERMIAAIDAAKTVPARLTTLKRAHAEYGFGRAAYRKDDFETARRYLMTAEQEAREAGSPLALPARLHLAIIRFRMNDHQGAARQLDALAHDAPTETLPMIHGRARWTFGLLATIRSEKALALESYRDSVENLAAADERPNEAFVKGMLAVENEALGDLEDAWRTRIDLFALTDREGAIQSAANSAAAAGWPLAAGVFYDLAASMARQHHREPIIADNLRARAHALALAGQTEAGLTVLSQAQDLADAHPEPAWDSLRAEIELSRAECLLSGAPLRAVGAATVALKYFESARELRIPDALLVRARAYRRQGDNRAAEADLRRGVETLERLRQQQDEWRVRTLFGDVIQEFGDELLTLLVGANRTDEAFDVLERLRAPELRRALLGDQPPLTIQAVAKAMPSSTALASFFVGSEETYLWMVRREATRFVRIPVGRRRLTRWVQQQPATDREAAAALRHALIDPIQTELRQVDEFVIVPDGPLHLLPFAALPGDHTRFLIQEHPLLVGASATTFLASVVEQTLVSAQTTALVVGDLLFDRSRFRTLRALPESLLEAQAVSNLYSHARVLTGNEAVPEAIQRELPRHDVFHFAGHSLVNSMVPGESSLVVSGSTPGVITATEVSGLPLSHVRLVVLSSCDSMTGQLTRTEGPLGLAQAFLRAGVQTVVASQAPVSDRAARELSITFHRELRHGVSVAKALQRAQLALLSSNDESLSAADHWASFVAIGGHTTSKAAEQMTQ